MATLCRCLNYNFGFKLKLIYYSREACTNQRHLGLLWVHRGCKISKLYECYLPVLRGSNLDLEASY